jgi:hypothetical protein
MTSGPTPQYADLAGKAGVVAGLGEALVEVVNGLAANGVHVAVVSPDRAVVTDAVAAAEAHGLPVMGMTTDPSSGAVWGRITQHIEQRLGPIDIAVAIGPEELRETVRTALLGDMTARGRGVVVEVDVDPQPMTLGPGVRHRAIRSDNAIATEVAHSVLYCVTDVVTQPSMLVSTKG